MEESNAFLKMILPRMVDDALRLTLDVIYPQKKKLAFLQQQLQNKQEALKKAEKEKEKKEQAKQKEDKKEKAKSEDKKEKAKAEDKKEDQAKKEET